MKRFVASLETNVADNATKINWSTPTHASMANMPRTKNGVRVACFCALFVLTRIGLAEVDTPAAAQPKTSELRYRIVATHIHDPADFTQGLVLHEGRLIESTGRYGQSRLCAAPFPALTARRCRSLDRRYFGEGVAVAEGRIVQLTWREGAALIYDLGLELKQRAQYPGEGWGLAYDGDALVMSDGSERLRFLDPQTLAERRRLTVHEGGQPVRLLNELEVARARIWANVWGSERIVVIDPASGEVAATLDLSALRKSMVEAGARLLPEHVLNGIAFDAYSGHFLITGKCWPRLFELEIENANE